ncbi:MAG TPA: enoyl-CoA hydratase-related protein [Acidimicrobiales bacterium]|nr:enoyl-CoA hydratase-related protein [Acidimicrobiales bacterium]
MTSDEPGQVIVETGDRVARITINRPERRNAMSWEVIRALRAAFAAARDDPSVSVVVLAGAGDKAFCSGADLGSMGHGTPTGDAGASDRAGHPTTVGEPGLLDQHEARGELASLFQQMWGLGKPTIARVQGWAMAGGFGLALACDLVVASENARFGAPEVNVGLWPFMITVPLVRSMPPKKALELMLTARVVDAAEADRLGFVTRVVPHEELDDAVNELAAALASKPPGSVKLGRDAFYSVWDMASGDALAHLHAMLTITTLTEDAEEGMTAFLEKRAARWSGR